MAVTGQTEVRLDGWCEAGLGQQTDNGLDCATMHEIQEGVEGLFVHMQMI